MTFVALAVFAFFVFGLSLFLDHLDSPEYKFARKFIGTNPLIIEKIGEVKEGYFTLLNTQKSHKGKAGNAYLELHLQGTKANATAYIYFQKTDDIWYLQKFYINSNGNYINVVNTPVQIPAID